MARAAAEVAARKKYEKEQEMLKEAEEQERKRVRQHISTSIVSLLIDLFHRWPLRKRREGVRLTEFAGNSFDGKRKKESSVPQRLAVLPLRNEDSRRHAVQRNAERKKNAGKKRGNEQKKRESVHSRQSVKPE
jgi:hypothetical protein